MSELADQFDVARALIAGAESVVVLTGAGISTDSGIPDFRGPKGVWTKNPESEKLSNIEFYVSDPEVRKRAWRARVENMTLLAEPNEGHFSLARFETTGKLSLLVTQNIDGLHHLAGSSEDLVVEIHGTARKVGCLSCDYLVPAEVVMVRLDNGEQDPPCPTCGGILKTATISFGQGLVSKDLERAFIGAASCDVLVAVGTSLQVFPIAEMVPIALRSGAEVIIVNGEPTPFDHGASAVVRGSIGEVLPLLLD